MVEHQSAEVLESWNCDVGEVCSLIAFFAHDSDPDLSCLNHVDVIATVTDCDTKGVWIGLRHFADDACLVVG